MVRKKQKKKKGKNKIIKKERRGGEIVVNIARKLGDIKFHGTGIIFTERDAEGKDRPAPRKTSRQIFANPMIKVPFPLIG